MWRTVRLSNWAWASRLRRMGLLTTRSGSQSLNLGTQVMTQLGLDYRPLAILASDGTAAPTSVAVGKTIALKAVATTSDNTTKDVTATWSSSAAAKATVDAGTVTGVATGTSTITATYGSVSATLSVTVTAS